MKRLLESQVKAYLRKRGFSLLSRYGTSHTNLHLRCKAGHDFYSKYANIKWGGTGCPVCAGKNPYSLDEVKKIVNKHGGSLLGKLPLSLCSKTEISLSCKEGHRWRMLLGRLRLGRWCRECRKFKYSDTDLILYIKELAQTHGCIPAKSDYKHGPDYSTVMKRLGGRNRALQLAGLVERKVSKKEAIASLREAASRVGQVPSRQTYDFLNSWPSGSQIAKLFGGSWSKAVTAAGMKPRAGVGGGMWRVWESTCYEVATALYGLKNVRRQMRFHDAGQHTIDLFDAQSKLGIEAKLSAYFHESHSASQVERFVKSKKFQKIEFWCLTEGPFRDSRVSFIYPIDLIKRLEYSRSKRKRKLINRIKSITRASEKILKESGLTTKKELLKELFQFKTKHGRLPTQRELSSKNGLRSGVTYARVFGNYTNALMAAGAQPLGTYWRQLSDKQLKAVFKKYVKEVCSGRIPAANELRKLKGYPSLGVYTKRAGTYAKWLRICNLKSKRPNFDRALKLTKAEALEILKKAYKVSGKPLVGKGSAYRQYVEWAPTMMWYAKTFGSWNNALRAAEIPLRRRQRQIRQH